MKTSMTTVRFFATLLFMTLFSAALFAQPNRGRYNHRHYNGPYYSARPHVSVGLGYNPYYNYGPVYRPRVYYPPAYRTPYPYMHYGPAFGIRINVLPFGYSRIYVGNDPYYYYDGIYYRPYKSGGYTVAQPPLGAYVKRLPSGAKATIIDGEKYYELGGTFYKERVGTDNKKRYEVVGTDGVLNTESDETPAPSAANIQPPAKENTVKENTVEAAPANGTTVEKLPSGCTSVLINQQKFFLSPDGVYYEEVVDASNKISYRVAGSSEQEAK